MSRGWRSVANVTGWQTTASLCYYVVFAATSHFRAEFGVSRTLVGALVTVLTLGYTLNLLPSGAAVDGFGEKRMMLLGLAGLAGATAAMAFAPSFGLLLGLAFLLGAFYAPAMPASNRAIVTSAPRGRESFAMGLKQVGVTAGSGAASLVVAAAAAVAAWQYGFGAIAAVAVGYAVAFAFSYPETSSPGAFEFPDVAALLDNRAYALLVAAGPFVGAGLFTTVGYTLLYVDEAVGTSAAVAGVVLAGTQVTGSLGRVAAGALADRLGGGRGAATVTALQAGVGSLLLGGLAVGTPSLPVAVALFLGLGFTVLGLTGVYYSCLGELVDPGRIGAATAGGQIAINTGGLLVPPTFGYLADTVGYGAGWALLAACALATVATVLGVRRLSSSSVATTPR